VEVIIPNPKTSGNGRYSYLAAWAHAAGQPGANQDTPKEFVTGLFRNVPVLDTGGRGATTTFAQRGIGDVLLTFENEAALTVKELGGDQLEVVLPSSSIIAEAPVAIVEKWVTKHGTREVATAYLKFLFEPQGQEIAARHHLRPRSVLTGRSEQFPSIKQQSIEEVFGGWAKVQDVHFKDGGLFDAIYLR
jgi:sulfate transport system substrate-binding protein